MRGFLQFDDRRRDQYRYCSSTVPEGQDSHKEASRGGRDRRFGRGYILVRGLHQGREEIIVSWD